MMCPPDHGHDVNSVCYIVHHCRCLRCRVAAAHRAEERRRLAREGRSVRVDADPVREHVRELTEGGVSLRRIAELSGVPSSTINGLLYTHGHRAPVKAMRRDLAECIMAVSVSVHAKSGAAAVSAVPTRRRLRALVAIGWTQRALAVKMGCSYGWLGHIVTGRRKRVSKNTAKRVLALFDELALTPPPDSYGSRRAKLHAQRLHWAVPLALDLEDQLDRVRVASGARRRDRSRAA